MVSSVNFSSAVWRKSSRSGQDGTSACVEVAFSSAVWRKSSRSGQDGTGACVEVAFASPVVGVRDSKNHDSGHLVFGDTAWRAFATALKAGC